MSQTEVFRRKAGLRSTLPESPQCGGEEEALPTQVIKRTIRYTDEDMRYLLEHGDQSLKILRKYNDNIGNSFFASFK